MRKNLLLGLLLTAPIAVGIANAQTLPPQRGWEVPPAARAVFMRLASSVCRNSPDGFYCIGWWASNYRLSLTGETGSQVAVDEYAPNWLGYRYLNCTIPGLTPVHVGGPHDSATVAVSIDVATYCWQWGYRWVFDPELGYYQYEEWPFPETLDLDAGYLYPDVVQTSKSAVQVTANSTGEKTYRHCNDEFRGGFAEGGFTLFGTYMNIVPGDYVLFDSSKCTNVGQ